jgi:hypothetical protein
MRSKQVHGNSKPYMLYYPRVQVFPMFIVREDFSFAQKRTENIHDARPSHKFVGGEGLD